MRVLGIAAGLALMCAMASPVMAADMAVKAAPKAVKAPPKQAACLQWIEQTYSWYNYCDPIPYYGRGWNKYVWKGGPPFN